MPRRGRLHVSTVLGVAALLLPLAHAAPGALEGVLVDAAGEPVAGAAVLLHHAGASATTRADGSFRLPRVDAADVLVVARRDAPQSYHHVPAGAAALDVVVPVAGPAHAARVDEFVRELRLPTSAVTLGIGLNGTDKAPFRVEPGARGAVVHLEWTPARTAAGNFTLNARADARSGAASTGWHAAARPFDLAIPSVMLAQGPGDWELTVEAVDAVATEIRVVATFRIEYGPLEMKRVEGRPPQVEDWPGADDARASASMDILAVEVTNETATEFELHLHLAEAATMAPQHLAYGHWAVEWRHNGSTYLARYTAARPPRDMPPRFAVGDCRDVYACGTWTPIAGEVRWGAPGTLRFIVPKAHVGMPSDGHELTDIRAYAYESMEDFPLQGNGASRLVMDATPAGGPYALGVREYAAPAEVVARLLDDGAEGLAAAALREAGEAGGRALPWLAVLAVAGGGAGVAAWAKARASSPYVVQRTLGKGAHGRVLLARHRVLHHLVAIKETWHPDAHDRVLREARTLARLSHPNVVRVIDVREQDGRLSIVMEYVAGGTLEARLAAAGGPLAYDEAARVWRDVLRGLEAAHALEIVHRDVKPANVLLTPEGDAKLCDFGLARSAADATLPGDGSGLAGTPSYMAPEQIRGEPPTPASDVFAAGALAYRLLAGRPIADASGCRAPWDVLLARQAAPPELPVAGVPAEVNALLAACLDEDPARRPSARDALAALEALTATSR